MPDRCFRMLTYAPCVTGKKKKKKTSLYDLSIVIL